METGIPPLWPTLPTQSPGSRWSSWCGLWQARSWKEKTRAYSVLERLTVTGNRMLFAQAVFAIKLLERILSLLVPRKAWNRCVLWPYKNFSPLTSCFWSVYIWQKIEVLQVYLFYFFFLKKIWLKLIQVHIFDATFCFKRKNGERQRSVFTARRTVSMSLPSPRKRLWLIREIRFLNRIIPMSTTWGADPVSGTVLLGGMSVLAWTEDCSSDKKEKKKRRCLSGSCVSRKHLAHNNSKKKKKRRNLCLCEQRTGTFWWQFLHVSSADHTVEPLFKAATIETRDQINWFFFFTKQCPCSPDYSFLANQQKTLIIFVRINFFFFYSDKDLKIPGVTAFLLISISEVRAPAFAY